MATWCPCSAAGIIDRTTRCPPTRMPPPPAAAGKAVLGMEGLILSVHSFLELLRRDARMWCRLMRDDPGNKRAWELRRELLAACEVYLQHSDELRRRLEVGDAPHGCLAV